jgi:hypothetical protein
MPSVGMLEAERLLCRTQFEVVVEVHNIGCFEALELVVGCQIRPEFAVLIKIGAIAAYRIFASGVKTVALAVACRALE